MRTTAFLLTMLVIGSFAQAEDWPMYQHDVSHSGDYNSTSRLNLSDVAILWTHKSDGRIHHTPVTADLDGDGMYEIVYTTFEGVVYALKPDGSTLWEFDAETPLTTSAAIGYRDGMRRFIAFVSSSGQLFILDAAGDLLLKHETYTSVYSAPVSVYDLDGDSVSEIIFEDKVLSTEGRLLEHKKDELVGAGVAGKDEVVADLNRDGVMDVIRGQANTVSIVADVDADGKIDLVKTVQDIISETVEVVIFDWKQDVRWSFNASQISSNLASVDINEDLKKEIVYCNSRGELNIINPIELGVYNKKVFKSSCNHVLPTDLNMDGQFELIMASSDKELRVIGSAADSDGDGLIDFTEDMIGTDKNLRDTDGDGLDDMRDEDPLVPRSESDTDDLQSGKFIRPSNEMILMFFILLAAPFVLKVIMPKRDESVVNIMGLDILVKKIKKKIDNPEKKESFSKSYFGKGRDMEKEWDDLLASESEGEDVEMAKDVLKVVKQGDVFSEDAAKKLAVSKIKLAKYAQLLQQKGLITIDSKGDPSNPMLRISKKAREK